MKSLSLAVVAVVFGWVSNADAAVSGYVCSVHYSAASGSYGTSGYLQLEIYSQPFCAGTRANSVSLYIYPRGRGLVPPRRGL